MLLVASAGDPSMAHSHSACCHCSASYCATVSVGVHSNGLASDRVLFSVQAGSVVPTYWNLAWSHSMSVTNGVMNSIYIEVHRICQCSYCDLSYNEHAVSLSELRVQYGWNSSFLLIHAVHGYNPFTALLRTVG